jgi:hypothetical protein
MMAAVTGQKPAGKAVVIGMTPPVRHLITEVLQVA